jgi:hypothetical protein
MELVRLIHPDEFEPRKHRFKGIAFEPYSNGSGISTFEPDCAARASGSLCAHARQFYPSIIPPAPTHFYFWRFDVSTLPTTARVVPDVSDSGDECHRDVTGLSKSEATRWFKSQHVQNGQFLGVWKCSAAPLPVVTEADIDPWPES